MKARFVRNKAKGQSIPIIALMIVVLVAMVGMAVDVGQTYAEQRNTQRSANAAAIAGMNKLIGGGDDTTIAREIKSSLKSNNIIVAEGPEAQSGERLMKAFYLDASGNALAGCPTVGSGCSAAALRGTKYIKVTVTGKVDTYFARVVGRNDLPVGANAWAGRGACLGIYPIAVPDQLLGPNGFINPDPGAGGTYSDNTYRNKTVMTIPMNDPANPSGGFGWLRWAADAGDKERGTNGTATEAMMTGPGNITGGFNEADWPKTNGLNLPKPAGYPIDPGQINGGDWVYPNTGVSNASGITAQLDEHIANKDVLILPIWNDVQGGGNNATYHVSRLAAFLLISYKLTGQGYFKVAYLGDAPECSSLTTPPKRDTNIGIGGQVLYRPRYKEVPSSRPPVQYEIILDVSGSMSWNYEGYGKRDGDSVLCTGGTNNCSGTGTPWSPKEERRIYFAKNAIKAFIDQMGTKDVMQIVSFSGDPFKGGFSNSRAINEFTNVYPSSGWSGNAAVLKDAVDDAGKTDKNIYLTDGRTPSAVGISRGAQVFSSAPTKSPATNETYKRVVIFLTDGVANVKLNGSAPDYTVTPGCGSEIPSCNVGTSDMPINAAGSQASILKQYAQIYVIAMAGVPATGLRTIASQTSAPFYSTSQNGGDLQSIFDDIVQDVRQGNCVPLGGTAFEQFMKENEIGTSNRGTLGFPTVGYATLKDENGGTLPDGKGTAPIQIDTESGKLFYRFDNLTPGIYQMSAFIAYKGKDGISHEYDQIYNESTALADTTQTIIVDAAEALSSVVPIDPLHLDMKGVVCGK
ncbi:MAG: pilus assembly protein TadG-related protein [Roseiflexaceae bacterium]